MLLPRRVKHRRVFRGRRTGNAKGGTPLMLASPSAAIDLPLKILVAENSEGKVWISYNSPEYLKERHGLPENLMQNIAVVQALAAATGE